MDIKLKNFTVDQFLDNQSTIRGIIMDYDSGVIDHSSHPRRNSFIHHPLEAYVTPEGMLVIIHVVEGGGPEPNVTHDMDESETEWENAGPSPEVGEGDAITIDSNGIIL